MLLKDLLKSRVLPTITVGIPAHSGYPEFTVRLVRLTGEAEDRATAYAIKQCRAHGMPVDSSFRMTWEPEYNVQLQWARLHEALKDAVCDESVPPQSRRYMPFAASVDELKQAISWELCCTLYRVYEEWVDQQENPPVSDEQVQQVRAAAKHGVRALSHFSVRELREALVRA